MGKKIAACAEKDPHFELTEGLTSSGNAEKSFSAADVLVDFSISNALQTHLIYAIKLKKPLIIGTTGHSKDNFILMENAANEIPLLYASNFSYGISLCKELLPFLQKKLPLSKISIFETHHTEKKDAPSGTALDLGRIAKCDTIGWERKEDVIGEHSITFALDDEEIILTHRSKSRDLFAKGALDAAKFLYNKPPGLYNLNQMSES